ncbi:MAG TPA: zf-HC2 domain-containing protein [Verrucomicrobiae bacterium]|nr:zf-HC2 domain-containing protein [Verrucomicrobiae bacterium]
MKPCSNNRKQLALLAADALNGNEQHELRAHIQTCDGCRAYLREISNVTQKLGVVETRSQIETSEAFHQRVVRSLKAQETASTSTFVDQLREALLNWRIASPLAAAVFIVAFVLFTRSSTVAPPPLVQAQPLNVKTDLDPTISNYHMIANRSLDKFDELLNHQASRHPSPTPVYTASGLIAVSAAE